MIINIFKIWSVLDTVKRGLQLKKKKYVFMGSKIIHLGFCINKKKVKPLPVAGWFNAETPISIP